MPSLELCNILVAVSTSCSRASYFHKIWRGNHIGIQNGRPLALLIEEENPIFEFKQRLNVDSDRALERLKTETIGEGGG